MIPKNGFDNKSKTHQPRNMYSQLKELENSRAFTNTDYQAWSKKLSQEDDVKQININFGKTILESINNRGGISYVCKIKKFREKSKINNIKTKK